MRVFFGTADDGNLLSLETHSPTYPGCTCKPNCAGLTDPTCRNRVNVETRQRRLSNNPPITQFVPYDCSCTTVPCGPDCSINTIRSNYYYKDGQFVTKPAQKIFLDGKEIPGSIGELTLTPHQSFVFKLTSENMPDGTKVTCIHKKSGFLLYPTRIFEMTYQTGEAFVTLVAPSQGATGIISFSGGALVRGGGFEVIGWPQE